MEIARLESFVAVAEELHFGRGAKRVHLTASPVSRAIKELERDLGGTLFVRHYHRIELTALGQELLPLARQVIADSETLKARARQLTGAHSTALLKLGVSAFCPPGLAAAVSELYRANVPGGHVEVSAGSAATLLPRVEIGDLDVALVQVPIGRHRLSTKILSRLTLCVIIRKDDPLAGHDTLSLDEIAGRPLVLGAPQVEQITRESMIACLRAHGIVDLVQLPEFDEARLAARVGDSDGLALVLRSPTGGPARALDDSAVKLVPLTDQDVRCHFGVVWRTTDVETDGPVRRIVELLDSHWTPPDPG